jgi:hypothetical protein
LHATCAAAGDPQLWDSDVVWPTTVTDAAEAASIADPATRANAPTPMST